MKTKIALSVLALCCAGGLAQAQLEAPSGVHVGPYAYLPPGGINKVSFGDGEFCSIREVGADDYMELRAAQFSLMPSRLSGNVGINTTNPRRLLHVEGTEIHSGGPGAGISFGNRNTAGFVEGPGAGERWVLYALDGVARLWSGSDKLTATPAGNIGIGTPTPAYRLHVVDGAGSRGTIQVGLDAADGDPKLIRFGDNGCSGCVYIGENAEDDVMELNARRFFFRNGAVGIGTTAPQAALEVAGQIRSTTLLLTSDRHAKSGFRPVNRRDVLKKLAALPLQTWEYTNAPGVRHLGPVAQDFMAAFKLGESDKHIATVDADGVALAAIQALHEMAREKDTEIAALKREVSLLKTELAGVKDTVTNRLAALEKALVKNVVQHASYRPEALQ